MMLEVNKVSFYYHADRPVLEDVSLSVETGECLCLLGPNGVGKTTLLRCLNFLETADGGTITVDNREVNKIPLGERAALLAYVPQSSGLSFP